MFSIKGLLSNGKLHFVCSELNDIFFSFKQNKMTFYNFFILKVNNGNTKIMCEIYSKLTIKTLKKPLSVSGAFNVNIDEVSLFLFFGCWLWLSKYQMGRQFIIPFIDAKIGILRKVFKNWKLPPMAVLLNEFLQNFLLIFNFVLIYSLF